MRIPPSVRRPGERLPRAGSVESSRFPVSGKRLASCGRQSVAGATLPAPDHAIAEARGSVRAKCPELLYSMRAYESAGIANPVARAAAGHVDFRGQITASSLRAPPGPSPPRATELCGLPAIGGRGIDLQIRVPAFPPCGPNTAKNPEFARFSFFDNLVSLRMPLRGKRENRQNGGFLPLKRASDRGCPDSPPAPRPRRATKFFPATGRAYGHRSSPARASRWRASLALDIDLRAASARISRSSPDRRGFPSTVLRSERWICSGAFRHAAPPAPCS